MTIETRPSAAHRIATELAAENKRLRAENSGLSQMLAGQRNERDGPPFTRNWEI